MFTSKKPTDDMFKDSLNIHNFVKMALPGGVAEILDPVLLKEILEKDNTQHQGSMRSHDIMDCLVSIFEVGFACSAELPRERMVISDAAARLQSARNILLANGGAW